MRFGMRYLTCCLLAVAMLGSFTQAPSAQDLARPGRPARQVPADPNAWTVGLAGGLLEGTFIRYAADIAKVLTMVTTFE